MHLASIIPAILPLVTTVRALCCGSTFLLNLEEGSIGVRAPGHPVTLDARRAGKLLVVDEHHRGERFGGGGGVTLPRMKM